MRASRDPHVPQTERLQIGDHILSTSCRVVEWHDDHCVDELVRLDDIIRLNIDHRVGLAISIGLIFNTQQMRDFFSFL